MANPYETSVPPSLESLSHVNRWLYVPAGVCFAAAIWFVIQVVMLNTAYATMTGGDQTVRNGMLIMAATNNIAFIIAIFAALLGVRRALHGQWLVALVLPLLGYLNVLLAGRFVATYLFNWYIANGYGP